MGKIKPPDLPIFQLIEHVIVLSINVYDSDVKKLFFNVFLVEYRGSNLEHRV